MVLLNMLDIVWFLGRQATREVRWLVLQLLMVPVQIIFW